MKGDPLRSQNHNELKSSTKKIINKSFVQTKKIIFQKQKNFFQGTTFIQFFMYCKAKKNFGVFPKILKFFNFQKSLSKLGPTMEDFNSS